MLIYIWIILFIMVLIIKLKTNYSHKLRIKKIIKKYFKKENLPKEYMIFFNHPYIFEYIKYDSEFFKFNKKNDLSFEFLKVILIFLNYYEDTNDNSCKSSILVKRCFEDLNLDKDVKVQALYKMLIKEPNLNFLIISFLELNHTLLLSNELIELLECELKSTINVDEKNKYNTKISYLKNKNNKSIDNFLELCKSSINKNILIKQKEKDLKYDLLIDKTDLKLNSLNDKIKGYSYL